MVPTRRPAPLPLRRSRISLSFSLFSYSLPPSLHPPSSLSLILQSEQLFTLRRHAPRANGHSSSREKWTRGCLMAPRRRRYRFIRNDVDVDVVFHDGLLCAAEPRRDAIERNARDVRNVGYFPVREGLFVCPPPFPYPSPLVLPFVSFWGGKRVQFFAVRVEIALGSPPPAKLCRIFCPAVFTAPHSPDFGRTAKENEGGKISAFQILLSELHPSTFIKGHFNLYVRAVDLS